MRANSTASVQESGALVSASAAEQPFAAAAIDASCRWPLLLLFSSGVCWLLLGTVLALISSIKLHAPGFLADCSWLTLGRVRPAALNAFLYGFASQVGLGVLLWLMCRLGRVKLVFLWPVVVAWKFWNLGVTVGLLAILAGASTGFEWLEMPRYAAGILFVAYALFGLCAVATFTLRRERELFPSQWYLLAALFWFPWIYSAANYLLLLDPVRGTLQAAVDAWYAGNLLGLWLGPLALAAIFYFLPKLTGQPLYSRDLAAFGFWTLAFFANFSGLTGLIDGPIPRWMSSVTIAANVCLLVPLLSNGLNWHRTNAGNIEAGKKDLVLRFVLFGIACYLLHGLLGAALALPSVNGVTNLTYAVVGRNDLALHGFIGMVFFGCLYYIVPRLVRMPWPNEKWIRLHFVASAAGVAILWIALSAGGVLQGFRLADASVPFFTVLKGTIPFIGLSTLGLLLLLAGQLAFVANFAQLLRAFCAPICRSFWAEYGAGVPSAKMGAKS